MPVKVQTPRRLTLHTLVWRIALVAISIAILAPSARAVGVPFHDLKLEAALEKAKKENKLLFIDFYATWCGPCKLMDRITFKDAGVIEWLGKNAISLKIDAEKKPMVAGRFRVSSYPTLIFLKPDGSEARRESGYFAPPEFLRLADAVLTGKTVRPDQLISARPNDPRVKLREARRVMKLGYYRRAMKDLLWCYDEGPEESPSFIRLRSTLVVEALGQLAAIYPPVKPAIAKRRDTLESAIEAGTASAFDIQGYATMNRIIDQTDKTLALYDRMRSRKDDPSIAQNLRSELTDELIAARRYDELAEAIDVSRESDNAIASYHRTIDRLRRINEADPVEFERLASSERERIVNQLGRFYEILVGTKRHAAASSLAARILEIDTLPATYLMLATRGYHTGEPTDAQLGFAREANKLSEGKDVVAIETFARLLGKMGDCNQARSIVENAVKTIKDAKSRTLLMKCLMELC